MNVEACEKMKHDLAELFNEKTMAHEEFSRMKNMVEAESRKNAHLDNELENTRQKLYRVEEQLTVNLKHTNSLTLELISTRKELILANNSVTSLQKYLGENDPHIMWRDSEWREDIITLVAVLVS